MRVRLFLLLRNSEFRPDFKKFLKEWGTEDSWGTDHIKFTLLFEDKEVQ